MATRRASSIAVMRRCRAVGVSRRTFLQACAALGAFGALPRPLRAQTSALRVERLSAAMHVVLGPNANVLCADGSEGVVLVDGGHASWSDALLASVERTFPGKPVRTLINTHWHEEQTGSNRALGERGCEIVAHENTTLWLGSEIRVRWSDKKYAALPKAAQPKTTSTIPAACRSGRVSSTTVGRATRTPTAIYSCTSPTRTCSSPAVSSRIDGWPIIDWWTGGWTVGMFERLRSVARGCERAHAHRAGRRARDVVRGAQSAARDVSDDLRSLAHDARESAGHRRGVGAEANGRVRRAVGRSETVRDAGVRKHLGPFARRARHAVAEHRLVACSAQRASRPLLAGCGSPRVCRRLTCASRRAMAVRRALLRRVPQRDGSHGRDRVRQAVGRRRRGSTPTSGRSVVRKLRGRMMPPPGEPSRATPTSTRSSRGSKRRSTLRPRRHSLATSRCIA